MSIQPSDSKKQQTFWNYVKSPESSPVEQLVPSNWSRTKRIMHVALHAILTVVTVSIGWPLYVYWKFRQIEVQTSVELKQLPKPEGLGSFAVIASSQPSGVQSVNNNAGVSEPMFNRDERTAASNLVIRGPETTAFGLNDGVTLEPVYLNFDDETADDIQHSKTTNGGALILGPNHQESVIGVDQPDEEPLSKLAKPSASVEPSSPASSPSPAAESLSISSISAATEATEPLLAPSSVSSSSPVASVQAAESRQMSVIEILQEIQNRHPLITQSQLAVLYKFLPFLDDDQKMNVSINGSSFVMNSQPAKPKKQTINVPAICYTVTMDITISFEEQVEIKVENGQLILQGVLVKGERPKGHPLFTLGDILINFLSILFDQESYAHQVAKTVIAKFAGSKTKLTVQSNEGLCIALPIKDPKKNDVLVYIKHLKAEKEKDDQPPIEARSDKELSYEFDIKRFDKIWQVNLPAFYQKLSKK